MFCFYLFILLDITSVFSSIQIIKVREYVNVTMTCHFDTRKSLITTNQLTSIPSLSSLNQFFDNHLSDNIILWYKDETQVIGVNSISNDPNKYFISQLNIHTYQLTIINVQLESSGLYKCQNFTAKEESHFQLNVIVPPSRLRLISFPQLPVADGTTVFFNCTSERAYPVPIFEWYKNDKLIQRSIGNQTDSTLFSSSSILTLSLTPADHNHILRCQVSNEASIHETNIEVKLDVLFKPIINISWNQNEVSKTLTVIENTFEILHCIISANPSIISNDVEWFTNDQLITGENQEQLRINFTRLENIEKLTCRAKNTIGQSEASVDVNILYKPKLSLIEHVTLNQGEKLVLKCSIDANPLSHQIRWFHNTKELITQSSIGTNKTQTLAEYTIDNVNHSHAGNYTCEVKNWLNTSLENPYEAVSYVSTDVRVQYAPFILNSYKKQAIVENRDITTECIVDAYPKADITWFGPSGQRLSLFSEEKSINTTVISVLHLPTSYSSILGLYRCVAKNDFGQNEFSIEFQRPSLPDPPNQLQAINITHASFILNWQAGYNGGSDQLFHIVLNSNHSEERETSSNSMRFEDLDEKTRYIIKIRSKNEIGFSDYSTSLVVMTKECLFRSEDFPIIQRAYYTTDDHRIHFQLSQIQSPYQLCIQYYNNDEMPACIPLSSIPSFDDGFEINIEQTNLRVKLCLMNQTDVCSKSISILTGSPRSNDSSELILIIIGGISGLCVVMGLIGLFLCLQQRRRKQKSKNGSTDTLKTNSDNFHTIPVRVSDTNSCLYYPANENRRSGTLFYNDETTGVYSIQDKKNSICFDSGMPSTTSNNSDSAGSQALSSLDFHDRSDGEYLVNGRISTNKTVLFDKQETFLSQYVKGRENHVNIPINGRISSEEESGFSTPTRSQNGKKLVYEVVV